jgi:hypothetical protein
MDPLTRWLIRLVEIYRNPPSKQWLIIAGIAIAVSLALFAVERFVGWPDWLTTEPVPMRPR